MDMETSDSLVKKLELEMDNSESANAEIPPLSRRVGEIVKTMQSINQRLKDMSIERRAQVSQMQWATIEEFKSTPKSAVKQSRFWQKSLFARTYFPDKDLDELFKHVTKYSSMLFTYLNNLNGKLQCKSDNELDTGNTPRIPKPEIPPESPRESIIESPRKVTKSTATACGSEEEVENTVDLPTIHQSFTDLIRAKVEFDSQFLKFNAVLSKTTYSDDFHCLYEICAKSNMIMEQTALSIDKCESLASDNGRLRHQKRQAISDDNEGQSHLEKRPRRSKRLAEIADEVQIIQSLKRIK